MLITKNAAELCVLLVSEVYGQLPSRIIATLFARGRSDVRELALHTSLTPKQIRHGLAIVIQHSLVFYLTDPDTNITKYEANHNAAYHLVRIGKILDVVDRKHGPMAKRLVNDALALGSVEAVNLVNYYVQERCPRKRTYQPKPGREEDDEPEHEHAEEKHEEEDDEEREYDDELIYEKDAGGTLQGEGDDDPFDGPVLTARSGVDSNGLEWKIVAVDALHPDPIHKNELYNTLAQLIAAGILETVIPDMFKAPQDLKTSIEQDIMSDYPEGIRGIKLTNEFDARVTDELKSHGASRSNLRRKLQSSALVEPGNIKRRKLANGGIANDFAGSEGGNILEDESHTAVLRVNFDKCLVELRNQRLVDYADDLIGETTAQVLGAVLAAVTRKIYQCQFQSHSIMDEDEVQAYVNGVRVNIDEVFDQLSADVDVSTGVGAASSAEIDIRYAEKIRKYPHQTRDTQKPNGPDDEDELMDVDDEEYDRSEEHRNGDLTNGHHDGPNLPNGVRRDYDADDPAARAQRKRQMRQHLLILAEVKPYFIRHCGPNRWTVDFETLLHQLRFMELDTIIEENFGHEGLRLTRILREKGKLDDKTLPNIALMKKPDVHVKMAQMEMAGFLEAQEVPRDNNRAANRTLFFWFFDEPRAMNRTLDMTYKSMVRLLERLNAERYKARNVLSFTNRSDVRGNEKGKLRGDIYRDYQEFVQVEKKLLAPLSRLDDLVSIFQDF
ncbi:RNA polymerase III subunit RPC82 [Xylariaceae sp. FL1019]|nr:RNA polymerase III subunit RPC82 [Xylariaceae sp. FL1019]